jgi:hypothetical protein
MAIRAAVVSFGLSSLLVVLACQKEASREAAPPPPAPPAAPAAAAAPAGAGDGAVPDGGPKKSKLAPAPTDGLSLAERMERRKADEAKLAAQNAADERERLLTYDRGKLPQHTKLWASIKKLRADLERAKSAADVDKIQGKQQKPIEAAAKQLKDIDPKGGNSNVVTDYDVMLNILATEYPPALSASFAGDDKAVGEHRAELDKRTKKVEEWLDALKSGTKTKGKGKAKGKAKG